MSAHRQVCGAAVYRGPYCRDNICGTMFCASGKCPDEDDIPHDCPGTCNSFRQSYGMCPYDTPTVTEENNPSPTVLICPCRQPNNEARQVAFDKWKAAKLRNRELNDGYFAARQPYSYNPHAARSCPICGGRIDKQQAESCLACYEKEVARESHEPDESAIYNRKGGKHAKNARGGGAARLGPDSAPVAGSTEAGAL